MRHALVLDPREPGQQDDTLHLWALWGTPPAEAVRHAGVVLAYRPRGHRALTLGVAAIDDHWRELEWEDSDVAFVLRGNHGEHRELFQWMQLSLCDDPADLTERPDIPDPLLPNTLLPADPAGESPAVLARRWATRLSGALLDVLAELDFHRRDGSPRIAETIPTRITEVSQRIAWSAALRRASQPQV